VGQYFGSRGVLVDKSDQTLLGRRIASSRVNGGNSDSGRCRYTGTRLQLRKKKITGETNGEGVRKVAEKDIEDMPVRAIGSGGQAGEELRSLEEISISSYQNA